MNEDDAERQLRDAIDARAGAVPDADDGSLDAIRSRVRTGRRSRGPFAVAAVAAAAAIVIAAAVVLTRDDGTTTVIVPAGSTSSAPTTSSSSTTPTTQAATIAIWPLPGGAPFATPEDAAVSFARDYLGFGDPVAHPRTDTVEVTPNGDAGPRTTVDYAAVTGGWVVTGARSDQVTIEQATVNAAAIDVSGKSEAFEAQIALQLRPLATTTPTATTTAMGGSTELAPYQATIGASGPGVLIAYVPDASGRGAATAASVIVVGAPAPDPSTFDGTVVAKSAAGGYVSVTSGASPAASETAFAALASPADAGLASVVASLGHLPTLRSASEVAVVGDDGKTVLSIDFLKGESTVLFTAPHAITSLDANALGGLLFTDDQTGLWRWDGPGHGPVQMTTGYVDAAW